MCVINAMVRRARHARFGKTSRLCLSFEWFPFRCPCIVVKYVSSFSVFHTSFGGGCDFGFGWFLVLHRSLLVVLFWVCVRVHRSCVG